MKQKLDHGLIVEKVQRVTEFIQQAQLKPYIDIETELKTKAKNEFKKDFFKLMNNPAFRKTTENLRKHRDIKLVTSNMRRNNLTPERNHNTANAFQRI